ncbi:MAG TPA: hypothetical protein VIV09_04135 [Pseudolabrys sp.]
MTFFLWACYILGQFFSMWKRANLSARSEYSPWDSIRQYVRGHAPQMGINFLLCTGLFWSVWHDTSSLSKLLQVVGVSKDFDVPLNPFTAAVYGVFGDNVMDFVVAKLGAKVGLAPAPPTTPAPAPAPVPPTQP